MEYGFYNKDCLPEMKKFPDKYFDIAIVDPPYFSGPEKRNYYGTHKNVGKRKSYGVSKEWKIPDKEYFDELFRVSKNQIIWGCNYFNYPFGSGRIIWDKVNGKSSFSDCEIAYCSFHNSTRLVRYMWNGMFQGKSIEEGHIQQGNKKLNEKRIHPTQKPINLYLWILQKYAKPEDIILDTHVGSASSIIAFERFGIKKYIGFELDKKYFILASDRLDEERRINDIRKIKNNS